MLWERNIEISQVIRRRKKNCIKLLLKKIFFEGIVKKVIYTNWIKNDNIWVN